MTQRTLRLIGNFSFDHFGKASAVLFTILILFGINSGAAQSVSSHRPDTEQVADFAGVRFVPPKGFKLEQFSDTGIAFMRDATNQIALFVALPRKKVNNEYFTNLASILVSYLLPQENDFLWKTLPSDSGRKVSLHQVAAGTVKGLSGSKFVQTDYIVLKAQGQIVVVGLIGTFGDERDARLQFEVKGREYSVSGWNALFEISPSITGEKIKRRE